MQRYLAQPPNDVTTADWREKAAEATKVRSLLFEPGLDFLRTPYAEQAEHMRTLWTIIEREKLEPSLRELIGDDFVEATIIWRGKYDEMLERRTARARGSSINLREQTLRLSRVIQNYVIALLAMIRDEDPENVAMIRAALRPIDALREQLDRERARPRGGDAEHESADVDEGVIDELIAEQQAIDAELGLDDEAATEPTAAAS